jgi:hypothetical protein
LKSGLKEKKTGTRSRQLRRDINRRKRTGYWTYWFRNSMGIGMIKQVTTWKPNEDLNQQIAKGESVK